MDREATRQLLARSFSAVVGKGNRWRTLFLLFLACNWKNLPFVWHYRFFHGVFLHTWRPRLVPRPSSSNEAYPLFLPVITSTRSPILECDYNIHKSNSTYFSDLDVSRTHLVSLLCAPGLAGYHKRFAAGEENGRLGIALGGVGCIFQREIKPYERYEMWTRVLSWDQKWVYMITHFVEKGAFTPTSYIMQPHKQGWWQPWTKTEKGKAEESPESAIPEASPDAAPKKKIFAFAISKYVFKSGRKTIPPEKVFEDCEQLPPRTAAGSEPTTSPSVEDIGLPERGVLDGTTSSPELIDDLLESSLNPSDTVVKEWTWKMVELERQRGMKIANLMGEMDKIKEEFTGSSKPALGAYSDLLWV